MTACCRRRCIDGAASALASLQAEKVSAEREALVLDSQIAALRATHLKATEELRGFKEMDAELARTMATVEEQRKAFSKLRQTVDTASAALLTMRQPSSDATHVPLARGTRERWSAKQRERFGRSFKMSVLLRRLARHHQILLLPLPRTSRGQSV